MARDIHDFKILKSRQLGVSTIIRALMLFWSGVFEITGALVFHNGQALDEAKTELVDMLERMPESYRFPRKKRSNRFMLSLENKSRIAMLAAGEKETKGSTSLGASFAISLAHRSELCSYGNKAGLEAMRHSMARTNPNRIFVDESTARGRNLWWEVWSDGKKDPDCICLFIGWWSHPAQIIERGTAAFEKYTRFPLSDEEKTKIKIVRDRYQHDITAEQIAWIRREMDTDADEDDPEKKDFSGDPIRRQEQPWYEEEAWQSHEAVFFDPDRLNDQANKWASNKYQAYTFMAGFEFTDFNAIKAPNPRSVQLKVWEEPVEDSIYIVAADPAYGINEKNDRSCVQVCRAFSDGLDQVAEYAWPLIDAQQLAWVMASLEAWYAGERSEVYRILEINGPGEATFRELRELKRKIQFQYFGSQSNERSMVNIQRNVRDYFYQRTDSINMGQSMQFRCLALDTPLPTPTGWTTMGEVQGGDWLLDDEGKPTQVVMAAPVMLNKECYRITFEDKTAIVADAAHIWPTTRGLRETTSLRSRETRIPAAKSLLLDDADLLIDPYVLGIWLGNGHHENSYFSHHVDDIEEITKHIELCGYDVTDRIKDRRNNNCRAAIMHLRTYLRNMGLIRNKHIPAVYLRGSHDQRLALLQGLMDTDGTIAVRGQAAFTTTSPKIAAGVAELVRTLGIKAKFVVKQPVTSPAWGIVGRRVVYQFSFTTYPDLPVFRLQRKLNKPHHRPNPYFWRSKTLQVEAVEKIESVPVRCIEVNSPSHLYLAGVAMVPTHNTHHQLKVAIMERLRDHTHSGVLRIRSHETLEEMCDVTREGDSIGADGHDHDDRVLGLALACRQWEEGPRRKLMAAKRTREAEVAKRRMSTVDMVKAFNTNQFGTFLAGRDGARRAHLAALSAGRWGRRR